MFPDYKNLILDEYYTKLGQNKLPPSLLHLRPARLRDECLKVCEERFQPRDLKTLRDFFGVFDGKEECLRVIAKVDVDKFKPLINYLNGDTESTNERNIELLAWLINFEPRPFELGRRYERRDIGGREEGTIDHAEAALPLTSTHQLEPTGFIRRKNPVIYRWLVPGAIAVIAVTGFSIMKFRDEPPAVQTFVDATTPCMYWTGEQYKAVPCDARTGAATVIAIDTFQLRNFKRVTLIDTITLESVGKLWYIKRNKKLEIFTAPGNHPEELNKQLKPLSAYMIKKHILKNER